MYVCVYTYIYIYIYTCISIYLFPSARSFDVFGRIQEPTELNRAHMRKTYPLERSLNNYNNYKHINTNKNTIKAN